MVLETEEKYEHRPGQSGITAKKTAMNRNLAFLIFSVFIGLSACDPQPKATALDLQKQLDSIYKAHPEMLGLMLSVHSTNPSKQFTGVAGLTKKNDTASLSLKQPLLIASNTKTYVAAAIIKLVENQKIRLNDPIEALIGESSRAWLKEDGYNLQAIEVRHLLSHTSGIFNYVETELFNKRAVEHPTYRWNRAEQIELATTQGDPLGSPLAKYHYCDTNYLLLTEILEQQTKLPFYEAIRSLLAFDQHQLAHTWFYSLEKTPANLPPRIHQYMHQSSSYSEDPSFDLYGGGGLAATIEELALFYHHLFSGRFFDQPETVDLLYTQIKTSDGSLQSYGLGIERLQHEEFTYYGHSGYWGTFAAYIPKFKVSVAISLSNGELGPEWYPKLMDIVAKTLARQQHRN